MFTGRLYDCSSFVCRRVFSLLLGCFCGGVGETFHMHGPIGMDGLGNVSGLPLPSGQQNKQILCFLGEIRLINMGFAL